MVEKTREGVKSVVDLLERMKRGGGIKGLDDKRILGIFFFLPWPVEA
jgi:hypothetical protein